MPAGSDGALDDDRQRRDRRHAAVAEALAQRARGGGHGGELAFAGRVVADQRDLGLERRRGTKPRPGGSLTSLTVRRSSPSELYSSVSAIRSTTLDVMIPLSAPEIAARRSAVITKCTPSGRLSATRRGIRSTSSPRLMRSNAAWKPA